MSPVAEKGAAALEPYNTGYFLSGDITKLKDPFFPFENAVDCWARSFAALGTRRRSDDTVYACVLAPGMRIISPKLR